MRPRVVAGIVSVTILAIVALVAMLTASSDRHDFQGLANRTARLLSTTTTATTTATTTTTTTAPTTTTARPTTTAPASTTVPAPPPTTDPALIERWFTDEDDATAFLEEHVGGSCDWASATEIYCAYIPPAPPANVAPTPGLGGPCTLGSHPDCIDPDGDGQGTYLMYGAQCMAAFPNSPGLCEDLNYDGMAGYPDSG